MLIDTSKERRNFMRMVVNAPVTLIQGSHVIEGVCRDLSANGMSIEIEKNLYPNLFPNLMLLYLVLISRAISKP